MQLHLFDNLSLHDKACATWLRGVHIAYRTCGNYYMSLYRLENFYVEIQYHTCYDGIASIESFTQEDQLQPYLDLVDLKEILQL
jgi:hypothetical protein